MHQIIEQLRAYIQSHGGEVEYSDFVNQITAGNRAAVVNEARKVFRFRLVSTPEGGARHLVSEKGA